MNLLSFELSSEVLLYLGSVAAASLVVAGATLALVRIWRSAALPLRHAVLVGALVVAVASPFVLGAMWLGGVAVIELPLERDRENTAVAHADAIPAVVRPVLDVGVETNTEVAVMTSAEESAPRLNLPETADTGSLAAIAESDDWSWAAIARLGVILWAIGSLASFGALLAGLLRVRRLRCNCRRLELTRVERLINEAARGLELKVAPEIYSSVQVDSPLALGIFRPCVVLPEGAAESLNDAQLRGLLMHELAHVARRDHFVGLLQRAALVVYWWNPLLRLVSSAISMLREEICDDLATHREASGDGYAAMLVELAGRALSRRSLPTAIGMFDGSRSGFRRRVERLLEDGRLRVTALDRRMKLVSGAICLALMAAACLTSIRLEASAAEPDEEATTETETPAVKWPKVLRGTIRDEEGKPVAGAKVRLDLEKIHEFKIGRWDETLVSQEMVTGADGEYRFDATKYPEMKHRPFCLMMSVTAGGYADAKTWNWYSNRDTTLGEKWQDVKLVEGRVVRGRVMTDYGVPVAGAVIKAAGDFDEYWRGWSWDPRKTDEDGYFTISVPSKLAGPIELWAVSRNWAPQRVVMPNSGTELADIRLQQGAAVKGQVTREDGSPVAGVVVKAESVDDGTFNGITFPVNLAAKTGADGRYELPPLSGIYKMYLSQAEESDDRLLGRFIVADGSVPLAAPTKVAVSGRETLTVDFRAGPGLSVSGTIRWADGRPVPDCEVKASYMPPDFGTGIWIDMVHTDADGRYVLRLPKPIQDVSINVSGAFDAKRVWHYAKPTDDAPVERAQVQFANLKPLSDDLAGIDWVLKREEELPELQPVAEVTKSPAAEELAKLKRRYELRQEEQREALEQAKTLEESAELQRSHDPRVLMAEEYLAFEEQHRGTDVGLAALVKLSQLTAHGYDRLPKLPEARRELYERLGEHYLQHPDLDLAFKDFTARQHSAEELDVIAQAIEKSPHESVQAAAIYQLACYHADQADSAATLTLLRDEANSQQPRDVSRLLELEKAQVKQEQKSFDPAASRAKALELARRLEAEFADVREPERVFNESGLFWRQRNTGDGANKPSYGALGKGLVFDLEELQIGLPAPDVTLERDGKQEYATQYLGKVTVIVFEQSFFGDARVRDFAGWAKPFSGKPLDVLVVRGKYPGDPGEFDSSALTPLRFVTEDYNGPIATKWSIRRWPAVFVVDGNGVIRARRQSEVPYQLVNELLKGAAAETERGFFDGQREIAR